MINLATEIKIKLLAEYQEYIPELAELLYEEVSKPWVPTASLELAKQILIKHCNNELLPMTFLAMHQGRPLGMASLRDHYSIRPNLTPWMGGLVVYPDYRGYKIGKKLIDVTKHKAKELGYKELNLLAFNHTIPSWYSKLGWKQIDSDEIFGHSVVIMSIGL